MKQYYYIKDGQQLGPYPLNQLAGAGLTRDTYVWTEGMAEWQKAGDVADFASIFNPPQTQAPPPVSGQPVGGQPHGQNPYGQPGQPVYGQPQQPYQQPGTQYNPYVSTPYEMKQPIPNSVAVLVLGICSIVFGFCYGIGLVLGIIGLALHANAKKAFEGSPDLYDRASYNNLNAGKICSIIGIVIAVLVILYIIFIFSMWAPYRYY